VKVGKRQKIKFLENTHEGRRKRKMAKVKGGKENY